MNDDYMVEYRTTAYGCPSTKWKYGIILVFSLFTTIMSGVSYYSSKKLDDSTTEAKNAKKFSKGTFIASILMLIFSILLTFFGKYVAVALASFAERI